jgi:hypothetical protein
VWVAPYLVLGLSFLRLEWRMQAQRLAVSD